jgi:2-oxoacid:acceptor oxidoreductase delta subunit (pyruvate/2-ketoisovalerate family)
MTATQMPFAITLGVGSSLANRTGSWRVERPLYTNLLPPCQNACSAGENTQAWLHAAQERRYEDAWRILMQANPFPAIMGRVCYHPCEVACNRAQVDEAVGINAVERFLGDMAIREGWTVEVTAPPTGRHVLVVGAGPSGLSAAYHLRLMGHEVTVRDAEPLPGGMMRYGIPAYRLPRDVLDAEIGRLTGMGVRIKLASRVDDLDATMRDEGFDAAFLAVGAGIGKRAYIPAGDAAHVIDAVSLLEDVAEGTAPVLGRRVVVYGGGNTAVDAARTAKRLGAEESLILYRRTRDRMPAHDSEVTEAVEEGVHLKWLSTVKHADEGRLLVERMALDSNGFPQPTGELEELDADSLVLALGQDVDLSMVDRVDGVVVEKGAVQVDSALMTGRPGVFAGGDMVPAERTVTVAVGHGRTAARNVDAWLRGVVQGPGDSRDLASFEGLNTHYYSDAPHAVRPRLEAARRASTFAEVVQGLDEETAKYESQRCFSCGNCFECDTCFGVCPDNAIVKLGPGLRYRIDYDFCKGCGLCVEECPAGAMLMVPEA